jgi:two-component system LytT family response regulator
MPIRVVLLGAQADALRQSIAALPASLDLVLAGSFNDRMSATIALETMLPDVAVVSSALDDASGFEFVSRLSPSARPPAMVFVSARDEDAVRAFELRATDFVPTGVSASRLADAMARARQDALRFALLRTADELHRLIGATKTDNTFRSSSYESTDTTGYVSPGFSAPSAPVDLRSYPAMSGGVGAALATEVVLDLSTAVDGDSTPTAEGRPVRVLVREGRRTRFIPLAEVDWFEADGNYIVVHAAAARYRTRGTITAIEASLDPRQFVRIHRRMVVNMDRVREMSPLPGGDGLLVLGSGASLRLSRTYRARVR